MIQNRNIFITFDFLLISLREYFYSKSSKWPFCVRWHLFIMISNSTSTLQLWPDLVTWLPILATAAGYYTTCIYNASHLRSSPSTMDVVPMCFVILLPFLSGVVGQHVDLDRAQGSARNDLDLVKERAYRSADPYMRHLLDSMQRNLATVKKMCNAQYVHPQRGM